MRFFPRGVGGFAERGLAPVCLVVQCDQVPCCGLLPSCTPVLLVTGGRAGPGRAGWLGALFCLRLCGPDGQLSASALDCSSASRSCSSSVMLAGRSSCDLCIASSTCSSSDNWESGSGQAEPGEPTGEGSLSGE